MVLLKPIIKPSPSTYLKEILATCGKRCSVLPFTYDSSICVKATSSLSLSLLKRSASADISNLASSQALPKPTIPGTFKVPLRIPLSCPPPSIWAVTLTRGFLRRTYNAPIPFGPYILCAVNAIISIPSAFTSTGILPTACTASEKNNTPCFLAIAVISFTGCTTPISLLAYMMAIKIVVGLIAASNAVTSTKPLAATGR